MSLFTGVREHRISNVPAFISETDNPCSFIFSRMKFFQCLFPLGDHITNLHQRITKKHFTAKKMYFIKSVIFNVHIILYCWAAGSAPGLCQRGRQWRAQSLKSVVSSCLPSGSLCSGTPPLWSNHQNLQPIEVEKDKMVWRYSKTFYCYVFHIIYQGPVYPWNQPCIFCDRITSGQCWIQV